MLIFRLIFSVLPLLDFYEVIKFEPKKSVFDFAGILSKKSILQLLEKNLLSFRRNFAN